jgi:hypothetical protein
MTNHKLQIKYGVKNKGAATLILVFFFMFISITILMGIVTPVVREFKIASNILSSRQSYFASESGVEDAIYRIKNNKQIGSSETVVLGTSSATTTITNISSNKKEIVSLGDTSFFQRQNSVSLTTMPGASFSYGLQVGQGGLYLGDGVQVKGGDIYINGNVIAKSASVKGNLFAASPSPVSFDVSNIGPDIPTSNVSLGYSPKEDFAQSFTPATSGSLKRVSLYLKTVTNAGNFTIKIVNDNGSGPGSTTLASWTTPPNTIKNMSSYGWVNADFSTPPAVSAGTKYWIIFDNTRSQWNHNLYALTSGGEGKIRTSDAGSWIADSPASSGYYQIYINNIPAYVQGDAYGSLSVEGNVYANTVTGVNINSNYNIYCQSGSNNKECITSPASLSNPPALNFPISQDSIDSWKAQATSGGTTGPVTIDWRNGTLGPKKIIGDLIVTGDLTVTGPLYVTGKIQVSNGGSLQLASSFGTGDGVVVADGPILVYGGGEAKGSGNSNSFLVLITNSNLIHTGALSQEKFAGYIDNGANVDAFYAPNGDIWLAGGTEAKALSAYQLTLSNGSEIEFKSALSSMTFSSSASGSWGVASWKETQ